MQGNPFDHYEESILYIAPNKFAAPEHSTMSEMNGMPYRNMVSYLRRRAVQSKDIFSIITFVRKANGLLTRGGR